VADSELEDNIKRVKDMTKEEIAEEKRKIQNEIENLKSKIE
jgi:gas vesicle protein